MKKKWNDWEVYKFIDKHPDCDTIGLWHRFKNIGIQDIRKIICRLYSHRYIDVKCTSLPYTKLVKGIKKKNNPHSQGLLPSRKRCTARMHSILKEIPNSI